MITLNKYKIKPVKVPVWENIWNIAFHGGKFEELAVLKIQDEVWKNVWDVVYFIVGDRLRDIVYNQINDNFK